MMRLLNVYRQTEGARVLFELLKERSRAESISHRGMPTWAQHRAFVRSRPYQAWYLIKDDDQSVGAVYLSKNDEVGLFIFRRYRGNGYATEALKRLIDRHRLRRAFVNVSPRNKVGLSMVKRLGGFHIQSTYRLDARRVASVRTRPRRSR